VAVPDGLPKWVNSYLDRTGLRVVDHPEIHIELLDLGGNPPVLREKGLMSSRVKLPASSLEAVMDIFGHFEKVPVCVNAKPVSLHAQAVHQWNEAHQDFCHPAPPGGGIDMPHLESPQAS